MASGAKDLGRLLRDNRDFRRIVLAAVVTRLGDWAAFVAVSGLVVDLTGRKELSAVVFAADVIPFFVFAPIAGVIADRVDRKRLVLGVELVSIVPAVGLVFALHGHPILAIGCLMLLAALAAFVPPAVTAALPNLVAPGDLLLAQTVLSVVWSGLLLVGAVIGGLLGAVVGRDAVLLLNAFSFVAAVLVIARITTPFQTASPTTKHAPFGERVRETFAYFRSHSYALVLLLVKPAMGLGSGTVGLLPAVAIGQFKAGDGGIGMLLAARGLGIVIGPLLAQSFVRTRSSDPSGPSRSGGRLLRTCAGAMVLYVAGYLVVPWTPALGLAGACVFVAHLGMGAAWSLSTYALQVTTPDALRARVFGADFGLAMFCLCGSSLTAAVLAHYHGVGHAIHGLVGMAAIGVALWALGSRLAWPATAAAISAGSASRPTAST